MKVASFYRFLDLDGPETFKSALQGACDEQGVLGTILVAAEGFNGSITGEEDAILAVFAWIENELSLAAPIEARWNDVSEPPFRRMRVRLKKEIVTLGRPDILPHRKTGTHVSGEKWNELIENPDVVVIDTRNSYEFEVGTFPNAVDPETDNFRQFPEFAEKLAETDKDKPLAMFCTGGIRCEKATALMLELGFEEVYHLQGGILKYLEEMPEEDNRWDGECFVFDTRVAVDRDLAEGGYVQCHACRRPLSTEDMASPDYQEGVSCPKCINEVDDERKEGLRERQKQVELARERGDEHIGQKLPS
jgi:UPF0176 protein